MKTGYDIALLGTSLTTSVLDRNWPRYLADYMQEGKRQKIRTHKLGSSGKTSSWGKLNTGPVKRLRPDAVLIEFVNDAINGVQAPNPVGMTPELSAANYRDIIDDIRVAVPTAAIFLMSLIRLRADAQAEQYPSFPDYFSVLPLVAQEKGVGFIDCYTPWGDPDLNPDDFPPWDGIHPNLSGYLRVSIPTIAAQLAPLID